MNKYVLKIDVMFAARSKGFSTDLNLSVKVISENLEPEGVCWIVHTSIYLLFTKVWGQLGHVQVWGQLGHGSKCFLLTLI